jgi:hypothetical protein
MPYSQTPFGVLRTVDACELLQPPVDLVDSQVLAFSRRWQLVGIFLRCINCGHSQKASESARPFPHDPDCRMMTQAGDFPWRDLAAVLALLPIDQPTSALGTPGNDS